MKNLLSLLLLTLVCSSYAQVTVENLDFEILENEKAKNWNSFGQGNYKVSYDTSIAHKSKVSGSIESTGETEGFYALGLNFPADFDGKKIKLTGYLKTENVANGWAGLWMRIDPNVAFDNMQSREITGTTNWTKHEIELNLKSNAKKVVVGGILSGTGKIWIDDLKVTIDGRPIENAPEKKLSKAQKDVEFDTGSTIKIRDLSDSTVNNLELLGKIWGFLKYYHPTVAKGNYNWDYELFRLLPRYLKVTSDSERDTLLVNWIESFGEISECENCKETNPDAFLKPDLNWIDSKELASVLIEKLDFIQKNRHQGEHYYIGMTFNVGNPEFKNENAYSDMSFPDDGFRLLSVYRYWNMIHYFFPYKHLMDKDWNNTLKEYIPQIINAQDELAYEKTMTKMIGDIKDTHANLWGGNDKFQKEKGYYYPPVHVAFVEDELVILDYYDPEIKASVGLEVGDVITHINDKPVQKIVEEVEDFYPASNKPTRLRDIGFDILRSQDSTSIVTIKRNGNTFNKTLELKNQDKVKGYYRWYRRDKEGKSYKMLDNNIGYVTLKNIKSEDISKIKDTFKDTRGIVIDIRNYPSTFVPFLLGSFFASEETPFVKFTTGNVNNPGEFTFGKNLNIPKHARPYQGKVIVLVNEISQSQAEYTAMAFRAGDNTTVIGSTTAGADGNVSRILLPGGLNTMISGIGVYYPDGSETQRIGIVPDIEVKPTIKGIKEGRDELLKKALEVISQNITKKKALKD